MSDPQTRFAAFPAIEKLAVIGDRRTAAIVAADGTIAWFCLPNFDGGTVFGALLHIAKGGFWRLGPTAPRLGEQNYLPGTAAVTTRWREDGSTLELTDLMLWPENSRPPELEQRRVILRRLRCVEGGTRCVMALEARFDFGATATPAAVPGGFELAAGPQRLGLWTSKPVEPAAGGGLAAEFDLAAGEEVWAVLGPAEAPAQWTPERAGEAMAHTLDYWRRWTDALDCTGSRRDWICRSAATIQLLSFAPTGAPLAAPTSSLPERIGGPRNYDYRYSWIRDASLSIALLSKLGATEEAKRFFDWLEQLEPGKNTPLQLVYRVDGGRDLPGRERRELAGYRGSAPVRVGNGAVDMVEIGSFGYLADCALIYLEHGGRWRAEFWDLIRRIADFTAEHWAEPGAGIWELDPPRDFVSSRVMCWVALDRAVRIAERVERSEGVARWRDAMAAIKSEIMARGWSEPMGSFRQHYGADTVDAALLLIPLMGFLPIDHPRVRGTVAEIEARLLRDGFVYRFDAAKLRGQGEGPLGESEGAFLMCGFWLAHVYALRGEPEKADAMLRRAQAAAGPTGLFSEAVDARNRTLLGNMPLAFSQAEYAKAALALDAASALPRRPAGPSGAAQTQAKENAQ